MKTVVLLLIATAWSIPAFAQDVQPEVDLSKSMNGYLGPNRTYKVTIESANGLLMEFTVPTGVRLSVHINAESFEAGKAMAEARVWEGTVHLRLRRYDEREPTESTALRDIMAKSPLGMTLRDVVVRVEEIKV